VNEYQFNIMPCPIFSELSTPDDAAVSARARQSLENDPVTAVEILAPLYASAPFSPAAKDTIEDLSRRIRALEERRGRISRRARSTLCQEAQPYQRALDLILFRLAGLSDVEIAELEGRLERML
jgi:hypothetical protein